MAVRDFSQIMYYYSLLTRCLSNLLYKEPPHSQVGTLVSKYP